MRLQTKLTLCILPLVVVAILIIGLFSIRVADKAIHRSVYNHMGTILNLFVDRVVKEHHDLLVENGLDKVPSYVADYQRHAVEAASEFKVAEGGHIFALDRSGAFVFCNKGMSGSAIESMWGATAVEIARESPITRNGILSGVQTDHVYVAYYFQPWEWVVFYGFSDHDFAAVKQPIHKAAIGVATGCALLLILLILMVFHYFFVKPVNTLMGAAASIAKGETVHHIPVHTGDELGALSRSMERMAEAIAAYRDKQESWQRQLEQEVQARTRDLKETNEALVREIEERENAQECLMESEGRYQLLFNTMMHGFALHEIITGEEDVPVDYRFLEVNAAFEEITGLKRADVLGKRVLEVLPKTESAWIEQYGRVALKGDSVRFEQHARELGKHFEVMAYSPKPGQFATIFSDTTERINLESRLRQAQKMESIGALAGGIAHDFNNILFPIIGYAEMSLDEIPEENAFVRENLNQILLGADRAKKLVRQILTFSRQTEHEVRPVQLDPIVKESIKLLRATIPTNIEIIQEIDEKTGQILGDPTRIHQIMMNLCTNAYHAMMDAGGVLTVGLKSTLVAEEEHPEKIGLNPGKYVKLSIRDTGQGIGRENIDRIFDPYFTTKAQGKGTGLGLSVVHGIVKSYDGEIIATSEYGKGALFEVFFPVVATTDINAVNPFRSPTPTGSERILLVDDEGPIAGMARQMLERLGYRVTAFLDSLDALDAFTREPEQFDLVITDLNMPKMTGIELAKRIINIVPDKPVILCTGFSEIITEEAARAVGIREYILKPIIRSDLANAVRRALDRRPPN